MRFALTTLTLLVACTVSLAQDPAKKRDLTLDDVLLRARAFAPSTPLGLQWQPDGEHVSYFRRGKGFELVVETLGGEEKLVLNAGEIAKAAKDAGFDKVGLGAVIGATWEDGTTLRMEAPGGVYRFSTKDKTVTRTIEVSADAEATAFSKNDRHGAYSLEKDVYVKKPDGTTFRITHGGFEFLTHGLSVSRVEFGIKDGLWWDDSGRRLAFYREDLRPIEPYPYIDFKPIPAKHELGRYPMAGRPGSKVSVGVYDTQDDSIVWLQTDAARDEYLTNVTWAPDGESLFVAHVNRDQNVMELRRWSASTGADMGVLFVEKDDQWVEPEHGPIFLPDGKGDFLWFSPRDGFNHLYLYRADGHLMQQVTRGRWDVGEFKGFDAEGAGIFFDTSGPNPLENHLYHAKLRAPQVDIKFKDGRTISIGRKATEAIRSVTKGRGQHTTTLSPDKRRVIDSHSNLKHPGAVDLLETGGKVVRRLHESKNPLAGVQTGNSRFFEAKTADGQPLHGHLILPPNLDESKKHPVLLYVYAGPHSQLVRDEWMGGLGLGNMWHHYMATQGFVVLRLDGRGTKNRGIDWVQTLHRRLGSLELEDQIAGLDHVLGLGFCDPKRVGVTGWSYGGFMTLSLMTKKGDRFRAGLAGAPVTDWRYYETGYGERYMDRPEENEAGYDASDPGRHVDGLEGRLLVVHGTSDVTVVWQNSIDFLQKCIDAGKDVDYMVYPGQLHGLRGKYREYQFRKMTRFFKEQLRP